MYRRLFLSFCLSAVAAGPLAAQDDGSRSISGSLTYLQRIALPEEAEAVVVAHGAFDTVLGEARIAAEGRQVPLSFSLGIVPGLAARLDAVIQVDGTPRWVIEDLPIATGDAAADLGEIVLQPFHPLAFATDFDCGGTRLSVGMADDRLTLRAEGRDYPLVQVEAASGARYVAEGDDGTTIWEKGGEALVTLGGTDLPDCVQAETPAPEPYRARGSEPGWVVTLLADTVEITADHGEIQRTTARPEAQPVAGGYVFDMPDISARLTLTEQICRDLATGMPHPHGATLSLEARDYTGCGGDPADLLTGDEWRIEDVAGAGIIDGSDLTLQFGEDGRVSGSGGCNRLIGGFTLSGEALSFSQMGSTMMACPDTLMAQERAMLDSLALVSRFDIDDTGALKLIGGPDDDALITARRP